MQNAADLASKLKAKKGFDLKMLIGLDGFVDEIIHPVDKRQDFKNFTRIKTIAEFGERISKAAGLSTNIEMVTVQTKLGGNGPILSNALLEYGVKLTYAGALGTPDIHPVFKPMAEKAAAVYSLCQPGHTDACEFEDGKVMMGKHAGLGDLTWDVCKNGMGGVQGIAKMVDECDLFGMENWTMMPQMSEIWQGMIDEVFPLLPQKTEKPFAFFDLADPEKRTKEDIRRAMGLIGKFEQKFRTILGLNEKEVFEIAEVMGVDIPDSSPDKLKDAVMGVYNALGIYCLMVHPVRSACCCIGGEYFFTDGPFCAKPKLTTGAGDNLNAGFCLGQTLGLDPLASLTLGVSTSGFYVRNAKSPTFEQVIQFAEDWGNGKNLG
ncbi:MAG: hypothetical protein FWB96_09085 [Defluviitaleaceae bacterium]|nr:hypothetical protein [Defluviitaleaceae bacterium]MCL2264279.1 hypothetical protein [Defluviitaleaceae bacterium]